MPRGNRVLIEVLITRITCIIARDRLSYAVKPVLCDLPREYSGRQIGSHKAGAY